MSDKGTALNKRVWTLFEKAGFKTTPSTHNPKEAEVRISPRKTRPIDLLAEDPNLKIKIIGENKSGKTIQGSIDTLVNDLIAKKKRMDADAALLVLPDKNVSSEDRELISQEGIILWQKPQLEYFEAVADALGYWSRYEIIKALELTTKEETPTSIFLALSLAQPFFDSSVKLFMFSCSPQFLLKTGAVFRCAQGRADAYQRIVNKNRLSQIMRFVTRDNAILPPNIIVHLSDRVYWDEVQVSSKTKDGKPIQFISPNTDIVALHIPNVYASLEIIDGQHRLYGFANTEEGTRTRFNLVVLGIFGLNEEARRDTFIAINSKARRVNANLVAYLKHTEDEQLCQRDPELMAIRLAVLMNSTSPFKNRIRLLELGKQKLTLKGLSGYDLRSLLGPRGLLRKYYPDNSSSEYLNALCLFFSSIRSRFKKEWDNPDKYIIATNRGISAFLKLLKSVLRTDQSKLVKEKLDLYLGALERNWTGGWETALIKPYIASKGWKELHRDMVKAIRKSYRYFKE